MFMVVNNIGENDDKDIMRICPSCKSELKYRDCCDRSYIEEGGLRVWIKIRRFICKSCNRIHRELPSFLVPYKHYTAEMISGVVDGVYGDEEEEAMSYPCDMTRKRWKIWINIFLGKLIEYLREEKSVCFVKRCLQKDTGDKLDWLECCIRLAQQLYIKT